MAKKQTEDTPLLKQYFSVKAQHPEAVLLYRVGDFYETYSDDAVLVSKVLGLVQTKRSNGDKEAVPMAGFPHHAIEQYLTRLIRAGYKVAVCDQLEDPKLTRTLVKRGATENGYAGHRFRRKHARPERAQLSRGTDIFQKYVRRRLPGRLHGHLPDNPGNA